MSRDYIFTIIPQIPTLPETKAQVISGPPGNWVLKFVVPFSLPSGGISAMLVWSRGDEAGSDSLHDFLNRG